MGFIDEHAKNLCGGAVYCGGANHRGPTANPDSNNNSNSGSHYSYRINYHRGLAFFIEERRKHYRLLSEHIFKPLSERKGLSNIIQSFFDDLRFTYDIVDIEQAHYYADGLKHLNVDHQYLIDDTKEIQESSKTHNATVKGVRNEVYDLVKSKVDALGLHIEKTGIFDLLSNQWSLILYSVNDSKPLQEVLSECKPLEGFGEKTEPKDSIRLGSFWMGEGSADKKESLIGLLRQLIVDVSIVDKLVQLKNQQSKLEEKNNSIRDALKKTIEDIDVDRYKTMCNCCPTIWSLTKDYLF